ncbi:hypothetical protein NC651_031599 [Populus alba x Populus x berolinensis]|nr:hypothetical protein NC651_031599 [Populus alba x Populus x berolinensis]
MAAATLDWTVTRQINGPNFGETKTFTVDLSPVQPNIFLMEQAHHFFFIRM